MNLEIETELEPGSQFAAYTVDECIGEGGMARVFRARHEALQRDVALKVMTLGTSDKEAADRFLREARMAAAIKHRNVVNIFDVGVKDGLPFMVMELLDGEDIEVRLAERGPIPEAEIIDIAVPVLAGLSAVHDAGIIHRDLKPGNIFLTRAQGGDLEPKLLDFGISKSAAHAQPAPGGDDASSPPLLMGTPLYMAPEVIMGREPTEKSDQYSLGVVLYECATGANPFVAETMDEVMQQVTRGEVAPLLTKNPALSRAFVRIVERAMKLDPALRYPDLRAMGRELLQLAGQRTRITWGLTFGDMAAPSMWPLALSLAPRPLELAAAGRVYAPAIKRWAPRAALLTAALLAGAASLDQLWPERDLQSADRRVALALPVTEASLPAGPAAPIIPATLPEPREPARDQAPASELQAPEPSSVALAKDVVSSSLATDGPRKPKATRRAAARASQEPRSVVKRSAPHADEAPSPFDGMPAATPTLARTAAQSPEWALSHAPELTHQRANEVGTNNAPILD